MRTWVADVEAALVGFVSARLTGDRQIGEIYMLAVDPGYQGGGIGSALTQTATGWLRQSGGACGVGGDGG